MIKFLRIGNGVEYCSNTFKKYCNRFGIKHEKTMSSTPQQNGVTERMNHTIMEKVNTMLSNFGLEKHLACYLINQSPWMMASLKKFGMVRS